MEDAHIAMLGGVVEPERLAEIEAIFFSSSSTQHFAGGLERDAFRERWLGRYLDHYRNHFFVAVDPGQRIVGYLAGCLDDPASQPLFADITYVAAFADLSRRYPAHLHVNVEAFLRNRGIGARLIEAFCAHAIARGIPGVHLVTGRTARNVSFYERCDFHHLRSMAWNGAEIAFLARDLSARTG